MSGGEHLPQMLGRIRLDFFAMQPIGDEQRRKTGILRTLQIRDQRIADGECLGGSPAAFNAES